MRQFAGYLRTSVLTLRDQKVPKPRVCAWLDRLHRQRTHPRDDVQLEMPHYFLGVAVSPLAILPRLAVPP